MMTANEQNILNLVKAANPINPLGYVENIVRELSREKLDEFLVHHTPTGEKIHHKSITRGPSNASIMVINDMVNMEETIIESSPVQPLLGSNRYNVLMKVFDYYGIDDKEVFYINAVNCLPHKVVSSNGEIVNRPPNKKEIEQNKPFIEYAIDIVRPKVIILLGSIPLNMFKTESLIKVRGEWIDIKGIPTMPTYNPGYFEKVKDKKSEEEINDLQSDFCSDIEQALLMLKELEPNSSAIINQ